ncbi:cytochrome c maturation protein CcmE [Desulfovibrio inopinatus]|uniref:cytochrome c maturation protein CcmE n=1 Tax=Desulfovibrio inopinatus TaxID=102109 RepID=UPI0003FF119C|nr:cytochrome c maturation protein CcmE [Desulfovibrio inopinatus]
MAGKKNSSVYLVAAILFLGGLGYLIFTGLGENSVYFLNVSEALALEPGKLNQARLFGTVSPDRIESAEGNLGVTFSLADKVDAGKSIRVEYAGVVPDTFKPGVEVIVEGAYKPTAGIFNASTLMTKCPSKYKKQENQG